MINLKISYIITVFLPVTGMQLASYAVYLVSFSTPELVYILFTKMVPVIVCWDALVTVHRPEVIKPAPHFV